MDYKYSIYSSPCFGGFRRNLLYLMPFRRKISFRCGWNKKIASGIWRGIISGYLQATIHEIRMHLYQSAMSFVGKKSELCIVQIQGQIQIRRWYFKCFTKRFVRRGKRRRRGSSFQTQIWIALLVEISTSVVTDDLMR